MTLLMPIMALLLIYFKWEGGKNGKSFNFSLNPVSNQKVVLTGFEKLTQLYPVECVKVSL